MDEDLKEKSWIEELITRILTHSPFRYLALGLFLILSYMILSRDLHFFVPRDFTYTGGPQNLVPFSENLEKSLIRSFEPWLLLSLFWKILLLLPAALFLSVYLTGAINPESAERFLNKLSAVPRMKIVIALCFVSLILIIFFIIFVFQKTYVTDDENAYVFQARIIEGGGIFAPPPPDEKSFGNIFIITHRIFTGKYTLGFPLIIALGHGITGSDHALPVLLAVLTILLVYLIGRELYSGPIALVAAVIFAVSPFFIFNAATLLSHGTTLFFLSLFVLGFFKGVRKNSWIGGLVSGAALGIALNIRQLTAMGFGLPFGIYLLWSIIRHKGRGGRFVLSFATGFGLCVLFTLWYNRLVSGSLFLFPFNVYDPNERLGFGSMLYDLHYIHTPLKGLENLLVSIGRLNIWFLGMPVSLLFLLPVIFSRRWEAPDRWCLALIASVFLVYIFYYSPGVPDTGPLYYFEILLPLSLLSGRGLFLWYEGMKSLKEGKHLRIFVPVFFGVSLALSFISFYPERALHIMIMTDKLKEPYDLVERKVEKPALVFIRSLPRVGWVFGYRNTDPWLKAPLLFCKDLGPENNWQVVRSFPDRNFYILSFEGDKGRIEIVSFSKNDLQKYLQSPK